MRIRDRLLVLAGLGVVLLAAATSIALTPDYPSDSCVCPAVPVKTGGQAVPIVLTPAPSDGLETCLVSLPPNGGPIPPCSPPPTYHTGWAVAVGIPGVLLLAAVPVLRRRPKRPEPCDARPAGPAALPIEDAVPAWARRPAARPRGHGLVHRFRAADAILDEDERRALGRAR
jgi:hypothetical protein